MAEPYRYRKRLVSVGCSKYVLIPAEWEHIDDKEVIVEVWPDKIVVLPAKK